MKQPFKIFSSYLLERFTGKFGDNRFVLMSNGKVISSWDVNDCREMIDALEKFVALKERAYTPQDVYRALDESLGPAPASRRRSN